MGCASSSPLLESGKNLMDNVKDSANDVITHGEKTLQDVGGTAKEKITTEMDHVNEALHSAMTSVENNVGSMMGKVGNTISSATKGAEETLQNVEDDAEETLNLASDSAAEAVSEAETVLASEAESGRDFVSDLATSAKERTFQEIDDMKKGLNAATDDLNDEVMIIEDVEQNFDGLGDNIEMSEKKVEELVAQLPTPATSPIKESKEEEPPPTLWEAAADAILLQKTIKSMNFHEANREKESTLVRNIMKREEGPDRGNNEISEKDFLHSENVY